MHLCGSDAMAAPDAAHGGSEYGALRRAQKLSYVACTLLGIEQVTRRRVRASIACLSHSALASLGLPRLNPRASATALVAAEPSLKHRNPHAPPAPRPAMEASWVDCGVELHGLTSG
eukprot:2275993-Rhodomonas_salina.2